MKIAFGSDERTPLTDALLDMLRQAGHEILLLGPPAGQAIAWPLVARKAAEAVADGSADEGILCCWTGTGVSIAANKIPGVRAALCDDAETARGARLWNDANVLCLSLRRTSLIIAQAPCALLKADRILPDTPLRIDKDVCKGCKACINTGCPALEFVKIEEPAEGEKRKGYSKINEALCVGCCTCQEVCKFGAIEEAS